MTRLLHLPVLAALLPMGLSCAAQSDNASKHIRALTEQVRHLQMTTDRMEERLSAIENARVRDAARQKTPVSESMEIPDLPVVRATAEPTAAPALISEPSDADSSRPLIVGEGSRIETRVSSGEASAPAPRRTKEKATPDESASKRSAGANATGKK